MRSGLKAYHVFFEVAKRDLREFCRFGSRGLGEPLPAASLSFTIRVLPAAVVTVTPGVRGKGTAILFVPARSLEAGQRVVFQFGRRRSRASGSPRTEPVLALSGGAPAALLVRLRGEAGSTVGSVSKSSSFSPSSSSSITSFSDEATSAAAGLRILAFTAAAGLRLRGCVVDFPAASAAATLSLPRRFAAAALARHEA